MELYVQIGAPYQYGQPGLISRIAQARHALNFLLRSVLADLPIVGGGGLVPGTNTELCDQERLNYSSYIYSLSQTLRQVPVACNFFEQL